MMESIDRSVLDTPLEPVIGLAEGETLAEYDGLCEAAPVFALSKFEIRHVGRRSPGRRGSFATQHSRCEFGFCRKGLSPTPEIQLAVRRQPVYNPALRCFR
jgi:hypothetical protein